MEYGEQSLMICGTEMMHELFVVNLDSEMTVREYFISDIIIYRPFLQMLSATVQHSLDKGEAVSTLIM